MESRTAKKMARETDTGVLCVYIHIEMVSGSLPGVSRESNKGT